MLRVSELYQISIVSSSAVSERDSRFLSTQRTIQDSITELQTSLNSKHKEVEDKAQQWRQMFLGAFLTWNEIFSPYLCKIKYTETGYQGTKVVQ